MSIIGTPIILGAGGGGGLSTSDAILVVHAPVGSTVTAAKNGTTLTGDAWTLSGRQYVAEYVISVPHSTFDANNWTITATKGTDSWTGTVAISSAVVVFIDAVVYVPLSQYQTVEYIEGTGTQWLSLTDVLSSGYTATIKYLASTFVSQNPVLHFGTTAGATRQGNIGTATSGYAAWFNNTENILIPSSDTGVVTGVVQNTGSSIVVTLSTPNNTASETYNITANYSGGTFILRNGRSTYQYGKYKVYDFILADGNNDTVRQMYPCYRLSDNVAGMYDKATDTFFTNAGSGTFTLGPDC